MQRVKLAGTAHLCRSPERLVIVKTIYAKFDPKSCDPYTGSLSSSPSLPQGIFSHSVQEDFVPAELYIVMSTCAFGFWLCCSINPANVKSDTTHVAPVGSIVFSNSENLLAVNIGKYIEQVH